ncbi:MAG: hypothetical protein HZC47_06540 [Methanobacterium sp.]|uniref:hypothetical protein n=1 Tax=Methanobacterium sp. TaxID=2164 RepID=UPI003D64A191|nr:hypothetical protein [Methanobacterium sp.]
MPYIICESCGGYYKLQENESLDEFEQCQCGGSLSYAESAHELLNKNKSTIKCPGCGRESDEGVFCPYCGNILDKKESTRYNENFLFHKIEAKSPKTLFGGRKVTSTDPKDWFIRDRLRVNTNGNYFREEVHSSFDRHENGGPGIIHSWNPVILIQDIASGHENSFINLLKTKINIIAGYLFYLFSAVSAYILFGNDGFQLTVASALIAGIITSFFANNREISDIFFDVMVLAGLCILTPIIVTFIALRYSITNVPGSDLTSIRLILILLFYGGTAIIGGIIGNFIRKNE